MELTAAILRRRMTRAFSDEPVEEDALERLLLAAARAPSAGFTQGVDLVVLTTASSRQRFWELTSDETWRAASKQASGLLTAPVIVLPVADPDAYALRYGAPDKAASDLAGLAATEWPVAYWTVDASFAVMSLLLAATDAGLGALFFRLHSPPATVLLDLGVPPGLQTIGAVALGHPCGAATSTSPARRARRVLDDVVHRERW